MVAHWESIYAPSVSHAFRLGKGWRSAGESYFRVDDQADVSGYSLSVGTGIDHTASLTAVDPPSSAVAHMDQITALARASAIETNKKQLSKLRAAAYQLAIWHLSDGVALDAFSIPNQRIRLTALRFLSTSNKDVARLQACTGVRCDTLLSTASIGAQVGIKVGNTIDDTALRISVITPGGGFFTKRHYVNLRVNGLGATLCAGEIDRLRVDQPATFSVAQSSCEYRRHDPSRSRDAPTASLPRLVVQRIRALPASETANNVITVHIP